jgi:hypothetical protein
MLAYFAAASVTKKTSFIGLIADMSETSLPG